MFIARSRVGIVYKGAHTHTYTQTEGTNTLSETEREGTESLLRGFSIRFNAHKIDREGVKKRRYFGEGWVNSGQQLNTKE